MRKTISIVLFLLALAVMSGCSGYNKIVKASDYNTKYSLAKTYFMEGHFTSCSSILEECVAYQRGTAQAEESMYLLATCYYNLGDYLSHPSIIWLATGLSPTARILRTAFTGQVGACSWILLILAWMPPVRRMPSCSCSDLWRHTLQASSVRRLSR